MKQLTNKQKYLQLCANENYAAKVPVFAQPFWLNAVSENWNVTLVCDSNENIIAALPFCLKGNLLTKRIFLPQLSFYQSVLFFEDDLISDDKNKLAAELFKQLPKTIKSYFKFLPEYFDIDITNLGYKKETYNSYFISKDQKFLDLSTNHKRNIQKGINQKYLIEESKDAEASFAILTSTFERQSVKSNLNFDVFNKLQIQAKQYHCAKTIDCTDTNNNLLASVFIVSDAQTTYYLFGGYNTEFKNSGAMTFLLHDVIQTSINQQKDFNFCGSSKKTIAHFFEGFGATTTDIAIWKKEII